MNFNFDSDSEIIDIAKYLGDPYEDDFYISSDEEDLNKVEFSEEELRKLCEANKIQVDLTKRNLYYAYEKRIRKRLLKRNKQFKPEYRNMFVERIKRKFSKLYSKYYLKWEKRYEIYKPIRLRQNKRNAIQFLNTHTSSTNTNQCINDDVEVENEETDSFQLSSQRLDKSYPIQFLNINNSNNQCDNNEDVEVESEETTDNSQLSSQRQDKRNPIHLITNNTNNQCDNNEDVEVESEETTDNSQLSSQRQDKRNPIHLITNNTNNQCINDDVEVENEETESFQLSSQRQDKSYPIQFLNINNLNNQCDNNENVEVKSEETTDNSQLSSQTVIQKVRNCIQIVTESDNESTSCSDDREIISQNDSIINFMHAAGELGNQKIEKETDNFYDEFTNDIACNYVTSTQKAQ